METNIYKKLFEVKKAWVTLQRNTKAFNYKYATLNQIQEKLNPILIENNLVVLHRIEDWKVVTEIFDTDSEKSVKSEIELTTTKAQDKWSEITYFRRYNLLSLLDLEVEDDDGKKAQDSKYTKTEEVDLPWIWDVEIDNIQSNIWAYKNKYPTVNEFIAWCRTRYKISKANAEVLKWIYW